MSLITSVPQRTIFSILTEKRLPLVTDWAFCRGDTGFCPWTTVAAALEVELESGPFDHTLNDRQRSFLDFHNGVKGMLPAFPEIESAAGTISEINRLLREKGFNIQLEDHDDPHEFATAGILNYLFEWLGKGELRKMEARNGQTYDAFTLKVGLNLHQIGEHVVMSASTIRGDLVCMTKLAAPPNNIPGFIKTLADMPRDSYSAQEAVIPMVSVEMRLDLEWMIGMAAKDTVLTQALQALTYDMDENGGRARSATTLAALRCASIPQTYLFDEPFLLWIERPGEMMPDAPMFAIWLDYPAWKRPAAYR